MEERRESGGCTSTSGGEVVATKHRGLEAKSFRLWTLVWHVGETVGEPFSVLCVDDRCASFYFVEYAA